MQEEVQQQPGVWRAALEETAGQLSAQLATLEKEHQRGTAQAVADIQEALAGTAAKAEAAVGALREEVQRQPGLWEKALQRAVSPVARQLAALEDQHGGTARGVDEVREALADVSVRASRAAAAINVLREEVGAFPAQWEAVRQAVSPVQRQLEALEEQHGGTSAAVGRLEEELARVATNGDWLGEALAAVQVGSGTCQCALVLCGLLLAASLASA
jgi:chromosome segregation ATPase